MEESEFIVQNQMTQVISETLAELKRRDYKARFRREATCLYCFELDEWVMPEDFSVDHSYSFQATANPDADRVLYAISFSEGRKGFLIDTCNVYSDNISPELMQKLQ